MTEEEHYDLCCQIDAALNSWYEMMEQYERLHDDLCRNLKEGFWNMSRARRSGGSQLQLDSSQYNTPTIAIKRLSLVDQTFHVVTIDPSATQPATEDETKSTILAKEWNHFVHQREEEKKYQLGYYWLRDDEKEKGEEEKKPQAVDNAEKAEKRIKLKKQLKTDPIYKFGLLPPPSLRQAQTNFLHSVDIIASISSVRLLMEQKRREWEVLYMQKRHIMQKVLLIAALLGFIVLADAFGGQATYFTPGLGACGHHNTGKDLIAALNAPQWTNGGKCGRRAKVQGPHGTVTVTIVDECPGCKYGDLDLSPTAFSKIAKISDGRVKISWSWV
ncbi:riboflavine-aldehyde-forming enzyme [Planoprotostelium fungivorum]|uniref:Riboflavine-aldehyde-forming enzyme n=1 Tax=Planoprotostelium fungivorum TaxID=1890364 RepID=A0A2P6NN47_9EUKA|nr:riboflavine-aldehyde-forming enzyme [Planoprotostelium fungivorum]